MISVSFHWTFVHFLSLVLDSDEFLHRSYFVTQSIFKGFRILGCSIFKMPFRCLSLSDNSFIIPHFSSFVNPFSEVFLKIFLNSFQSSLCVISFFIIPHFSSFVKPFSELFWSFISELSSFLLNFSLVRYFLLYHFFTLLSSAFRDKFLLLLSFALLN